MQQYNTPNIPKSVGRPSIMTNETVVKLVDVLKRGFSIQAACNYAQIDRTTFYRHLRTDPIFATKMSTSVMYLYLAASETLFKKIAQEHDPKIAMWYLERVDPERWGRKKFCQKCHKLQQKHKDKHVYFDVKETPEWE